MNPLLEKDERNELSWWFPRIKMAGVPVPKTVIVETTPEEREAIYPLFDGEGQFPQDLRQRVRMAADVVGWPAFLRTDHVSGKHDWCRTCFMDDPEMVVRNIMGLIEYTETIDWLGTMPWNRLAVREFLPTMPVGVCEGYGGMPICREFRFFVDDGVVRCHHPYWPVESLEQGRAAFGSEYEPDQFSRLTDEELTVTTAMVETAGRAVGGSWSIDVLETRRGWYVTDMALAKQSYHSPDCKHRHDAPPDGSIMKQEEIDPETLLMPKEG